MSAEAALMPGEQCLHKRGDTYEVRSRCLSDADYATGERLNGERDSAHLCPLVTDPILKGEEIVIYRRIPDGESFARAARLFDEPGRFTRLPGAAVSAEALVETLSAGVHADWMEEQRRRGRSSSIGRDGEEYMVPYSQLSESAKELDRVTVRAVLKHLPAPAQADALRAENERLTEALDTVFRLGLNADRLDVENSHTVQMKNVARAALEPAVSTGAEGQG